MLVRGIDAEREEACRGAVCTGLSRLSQIFSAPFPAKKGGEEGGGVA